mmetsp:Transcript_11152/g.14697  ORF Transcript_11152/g.14697 Transcript_11152/m.14697 type:complete len:536 (-) Transcript_11152:66-1673(-)
MTFKLGFSANRHLNRRRDRTRSVFDHVHAVEEVSADLVHLVDEHDARNLVAVSLTPHGFGLGFNTGVGVQNTDCTVENRQRTLNFDGEVNVAGGVDDVQTVLRSVSGLTIFGAFPESGGRSRGDGDAAFLLLLHPVHGGCTIVHLTDVVGFTSVIQDTLGTGGFTCIDVRHNTEVTVMVECIVACHRSEPLGLPAVVREGLVGLCHLVGVFALLNRSTAGLYSVQQLTGEAFFHGVFVAGTCRFDQPTDCQGFAALGAHFDRNLVGGTTHTTRTHFDGRLNVVEGFVEHFHGGALDFCFNAIERVVDDTLCGRLFTVDHQVVHEFGQYAVAKLCVGQDFTFLSSVTARHLSISFLLRTLRAVLGAALLTVFDALGIQNTTQDVVTNTGKVFYTAATDQNHGVFLKVVAFTGDVGDHFETVGQANLRNFPHSGVRFLRSGGVYTGADAALLRALFQVHGLRAFYFRLPRLADQLLDRWHSGSFPVSTTHVSCTSLNVRLNLSHLRVRKRKNRNRSHSEVNDAVGLQRIRANRRTRS